MKCGASRYLHSRSILGQRGLHERRWPRIRRGIHLRNGGRRLVRGAVNLVLVNLSGELADFPIHFASKRRTTGEEHEAEHPAPSGRQRHGFASFIGAPAAGEICQPFPNDKALHGRGRKEYRLFRWGSFSFSESYRELEELLNLWAKSPRCDRRMAGMRSVRPIAWPGGRGSLSTTAAPWSAAAGLRPRPFCFS